MSGMGHKRTCLHGNRCAPHRAAFRRYLFCRYLSTVFVCPFSTMSITSSLVGSSPALAPVCQRPTDSNTKSPDRYVLL